MESQAVLLKVKELVDKAREVLLVTHENPTHDSIGSTLALYLGLIGLGKKVTIACPDPVTVELSSYVGVQKIISDLSNKNFVISLDYVDGSIEKVSYNIEGDKFNLVVEPRVGYEPFSQEKVHYSYAGSAADLVIAVDTTNLGGLKKLYEADKNIFASKPVVNVDHHSGNAMFGSVNIVDPQASTTIEVVAQLISTLGVKLTPDIATNIVNAVYNATDNFSSPAVTPLALELAATCLRSGGKRFGQPGQAEVPAQAEVTLGSVQPLPSMPIPTPVPQKPFQQINPVGTSQVSSTNQHTLTPSTPKSISGQALPSSLPSSGQAGQAPADWLKPKIFKSSSLL